MKKVALITGASRGIGKAVAERLAKDGFAVVVNYASSAPEAEEVVSKINAEGGQAIAIKADVSDAGPVEQLFAQTLDKLGSVDVVVQNSGIMPLSPIGNGDAATFDQVIGVNLRGTFLVLAQIAEFTKMNPLERMGQPSDIANVVSFLAGPDGGWINSQILLANGGFAY